MSQIETKHILRLHANENPYALPKEFIKAVQAEVAVLEFNRYPDRAMRKFYHALAEYTGYGREMLLVGNGLEEVILLLLVALGPRGRVVLPTPTFFVYEQVAKTLGLSLLKIPLKESSWDLDVPLIIEEAGNEEGLLIICNPNNPTGNVFPRNDILQLLQETKLTVVVDEAYYGFTPETMLTDVAQNERLILLRTFSKTYGLAGIRLGYMVAESALIDAINQVRPTFNLDAQTAAIGGLALEQQAALFANIPQIIDEREYLARELSALPGVKVFPSQTNFLFLKLPCMAEPIWQELRAEGINVRQEGEAMPNYLRISVGLREENERLLTALKQSDSCPLFCP